MNLPALAARYARITPKKTHVALPLLVMAVLYWLSSLPGTRLLDGPELYALFYWVPPSVQNALHVPAYAALACAWYWALSAWTRNNAVVIVTTFMLAAGFGLFDEWHQSFVPGRYGSFTDVVLNVAGATLGLWLAAWVRRNAAGSTAAVATHDSRA